MNELLPDHWPFRCCCQISYTPRQTCTASMNIANISDWGSWISNILQQQKERITVHIKETDFSSAISSHEQHKTFKVVTNYKFHILWWFFTTEKCISQTNIFDERQKKQYFSSEQLLTFYNIQITATINYCSRIWDEVSTIHSLIDIQYKAICLID